MEALFILSVFTAMLVFVNNVFTVKLVFVNSVGLRVFQKSKTHQFLSIW